MAEKMLVRGEFHGPKGRREGGMEGGMDGCIGVTVVFT